MGVDAITRIATAWTREIGNHHAHRRHERVALLTRDTKREASGVAAQ